jgi:hypothetical protein
MFVWVRGAKTTGPITKIFCFFLNLIFSAVRNFEFRHMFCRYKKFGSVKSRFTNFGQYWLSTVYFLGDFNETFRLLFVHAHLLMCQVSLKNIQKLNTPFLTGPISGNGPLWNIFFITEWIALKLTILTDIKIRLKKNQTFSQSAK